MNQVIFGKRLSNKQFSVSGFTSVKQDYGFIPFQDFSNYPSYNFTINSGLNFNFLDIPICLDFYHTTNKNQASSLNHLGFKFDVEEYKSRVDKYRNIRKEEWITKLDSLYLIKSQLQSKLFRTESQIDSLNKSKNKYLSMRIDNDLQKHSDIISSNYSLNRISDNDSAKFKRISKNQKVVLEGDTQGGSDLSEFSQLKSDIKPDKIVFDSIIFIQSNISDSLLILANKKTLSSKLKFDSLTISKKIILLNDSIEKVKSIISVFNNAENQYHYIASGKLKKEYCPDLNNYLQKISRFEIGQAQPNYSVWLIRNTLKGINVQTISRGYFTAFSYGTIVDFNYINRLNGGNPLKNIAGDFNNFLSLNSANGGRKIISGEIGWGNLEKSFIAFGMLKGNGKASNISNDGDLLAYLPNERNLVGEINGKAVFGKSSISFALANSVLESVQGNNENLVQNLLKSKNSKAIDFTGSTSIINKLTVQSEVKYIEPYFKSFGLGYLRSDLFSSTTKIEKRISKVKISTFYKFEKNNLLNNLSYQNKSYSGGLSVAYKLNKNWNIKGSYSPVFIETKIKNENNTLFKNINYLFSSTFHKNYNAADLVSSFNIVNNYAIDNSSILRFYNYSFTNILSKEDKVISLSFYYLKTNSSIIKTNFYITELSYSKPFLKDKILITLNGKVTRENQLTDLGYMAEVNYKLSKSIVASASIEKYSTSSFYQEKYFLNLSKQIAYSLEVKYLFNTYRK